MEHLVDYYAASGIRGLLVPSSTGEVFALSAKDRANLVEVAAKKSAARLSILANCSEHNIESVLRDARLMADAGADVIVSMPPQFHEYSQDELKDYFFTIADQSPLPLLIYNHMTRLPNRVSVDLLKTLASHERIIGIKDTHNDPGRMLQLTALGIHKNFAILCGGEGVSAYAALLGMEMLNALSAVKPKLFLNLYAAGRAGEIEKAARYQLEVNKLMGLFTVLHGGLSSSTLFSQAIKAALSLKGLCGVDSVQLGYPLEPGDLVKVRAVVDSVKEKIE